MNGSNRMVAKQFSHLFRPIKFGNVWIKNRICMPAMGTNYSTSAKGHVTQQLVDYYEERAMGGVGLIIVGAAMVSLSGKVARSSLCINDDTCVPGLKETVEAIHRHGAAAAIQFQHGGRACRSSITGVQPIAPSAIPVSQYETPREASLNDIQLLIGNYVRAARRAKMAGFDGIEIHASGGYLVCQFLSASSNRRQDGYGGTLANRARFLLEIILGIKKELGMEFPVWCKLSATEFGVAGGLTIDQAQAIARMVEEVGGNAIEVFASGDWVHSIPPAGSPPGLLVPLVEKIKEVVHLPVIATSKVSPDLGEALLSEGKADMIAMGRALLADPQLVNKLTEGRTENIRPCIGCMQCIDETMSDSPLRCTVNAFLGKEREARLKVSKLAKRVMVVGGGPAGMEAARTLRSRGAQVTLWEKECQLGGQLVLAAKPPFKQEINRFIDYLCRELVDAGVNTRLGQEVTGQIIQDYNPDAVVIATGSVPLTLPHATPENIPILDAAEALNHPDHLGRTVAVIGGGLVGCEVAMFLAQQDRRVTIIEMQSRLAPEVKRIARRILLDHLAEFNVACLTGIKVMAITKEGIKVENKDGQSLIEAEGIVSAIGFKPNLIICHRLADKFRNVHLIGDCRDPRNIMEAISQGAEVGRAL